MEQTNTFEKKFVIWMMIAIAIVSALPMIIGVLTAPQGWQFIGYPFATDDHMVYASWMRQAQDGKMLFDNRFAVDQQPSMTINLYFFVLGIISKITGIAWATTIAKSALSALFVWLSYRLLKKLSLEGFALKLSLVMVVFGAGFGFLVWHQFGESIVKESIPGLGDFLHSRLPTDVWQPEGFVFSSMLTNSLFMAALCLIMTVFLSILEAESSWKPVIMGSIAMLLLANIHSYDALLVGMVSIGFVIAMAAQKKLTAAWLMRGLCIFLGAVPSALWLMNVLKNDPVFQARAATLTYSPNFREVFMGYGLLLILGAAYLFMRSKKPVTLGGAGLAAVNILALIVAGSGPTEGLFLSSIGFSIVAVTTLVAVGLNSDEDSALSMVISWALVGLIAMYFPALFQRKLAMGLSIPWAILAALALSKLLEKVGSEPKRIFTGAALVVTSLSSIFWLQREVQFVKKDVSRTTVNSLFLPPEMLQIIASLNARSNERRVVLAMPGLPEIASDDEGITSPDNFTTPLWPDMNPVLAGFSGTFAYAGHWSETPDYLSRRKEVTKFYFARTPNSYRRALIEKSGANYLLGPTPTAFGSRGQSGFLDVSRLGEVIVAGREFQLVKIDPAKLQD